jgi:hypothetical protein
MRRARKTGIERFDGWACKGLAIELPAFRIVLEIF